MHTRIHTGLIVLWCKSDRAGARLHEGRTQRLLLHQINKKCTTISDSLSLSVCRRLSLSQLWRECTSNLYNSHYIKLSPKGILGIEVGSVCWKDGAIRFTSNKAPIRRSVSFIK